MCAIPCSRNCDSISWWQFSPSLDHQCPYNLWLTKTSVYSKGLNWRVWLSPKQSLSHWHFNIWSPAPICVYVQQVCPFVMVGTCRGQLWWLGPPVQTHFIRFTATLYLLNQHPSHLFKMQTSSSFLHSNFNPILFREYIYFFGIFIFSVF